MKFDTEAYVDSLIEKDLKSKWSYEAVILFLVTAAYLYFQDPTILFLVTISMFSYFHKKMMIFKRRIEVLEEKVKGNT